MQQQLSRKSSENERLQGEKTELSRILSESLASRNAALLQLGDVASREEAITNRFVLGIIGAWYSKTHAEIILFSPPLVSDYTAKKWMCFDVRRGVWKSSWLG